MAVKLKYHQDYSLHKSDFFYIVSFSVLIINPPFIKVGVPTPDGLGGHHSIYS